MLGETISHYRILEKLGQGGMGVVYRALNTHLQRDVALKVLPQGALSDQSARKRLREEALALSRCNHPNIETVHDFDTEAGIDFLVVEYLRGLTVEQRLRAEAFRAHEVITLGQQIAEGLSAAHEQSVIHRDLKPSNLLITTDGRLKILDFGLAKHLKRAGDHSRASTLSMSTNFAGTPPYMAPEQLRGETVDVRADLFGLGTVLYEMATRSRAFPGRTPPETTDFILHRDPVPPRNLQPNIPPELERIILKCLEKQPQDRYQSAAEIAVDLRRLESSLRPTAAVAARAERRPIRMALVTGVLALAVLIASYMIWNAFQERASISGRKLMLAVLPFDNLSQDPGQEYFGDGITEEMLSQLGRLQPDRLGVIARTSIMRYKGTQKPISEIGDELGVDYILEGSVRRAADRVRVTAQLIQVSDETHLWADSYDRELRDILMLQSEVAQAIAREIHLTLSAQQRSQLQSPRTVDQEAFEAYLKGRYWWNRRSPEAMFKGVEYFNAAIIEDPGYAQAYAGLANSYLMLGAYDAIPPRDAYTKARTAASRSLEINPLLADAEACMAYVTFLQDWDWEIAEQRYQRTLELDANYAMGHIWYAIFLASRERPAEAIEQANIALELDPLSLIVGALRGWILYLCGDYDASIEQCQETLELDSTFFPAHLFISRPYLQKGMCDEANQSIEEAYRLTGNDQSLQSEYAYSLAMCGKTEMAEQVISELEDDDDGGYLIAANLALLQTAMGNHDEAITWLEAAIDERYPWMVQLGVDPWWKPLRDHPRYAELERRIGL